MSSNLRDQFIDHMTLQGFSECNKKSYVSAVKGLAAFYNLSPDLLKSEQIHHYIRYLITKSEGVKSAFDSSELAPRSTYFKSVFPGG